VKKGSVCAQQGVSVQKSALFVQNVRFLEFFVKNTMA
jgi:hypothetical protein